MTGSEIAVAHEHYIERGGGEHVADELARTFNADLFGGLVRADSTGDDLDPEPVCGGLLSKLMEKSMAVRDLVYWQAWRHAPELNDYDVVIQSGNNPGWYVPNPEQTIVKYVHTTQRTPYDRWHGSEPGILKRGYAEAARQLYQETLTYPSVFVANSEIIARRCRKYWGVPEDRLEVVYPPTDVDSYGTEHAGSGGDYYFTFSRLYPPKRIDQIVQAFTQLDDSYRLVVGGSGPERERLEEIADDSVEFVGFVSEAEKRRRLAECKAFVFAAESEDFGLCPVEAFASGTPVLGVAEGYTEHQIYEGENGLTFDPSPDEIASVVRAFEASGVSWTPAEIEAFAEQFGLERFRNEMRRIVDEARERNRVVTDHRPRGGAVTEHGPESQVIADGGTHD